MRSPPLGLLFTVVALITLLFTPAASAGSEVPALDTVAVAIDLSCELSQEIEANAPPAAAPVKPASRSASDIADVLAQITAGDHDTPNRTDPAKNLQRWADVWRVASGEPHDDLTAQTNKHPRARPPLLC